MNPQPFGGSGGGGGQDAAVMGVMVGVILVALVVGLTIQIFFLLTLSRALGHCRPGNRDMEPGMVWLNLIPCFNLVWNFFLVLRVASSLRREFDSRGMPREDDYGQNVGIAYAVLVVVSVAPIPFVQTIIGLASLVCFILYWVKIAGYNRELEQSAAGGLPDLDRRGEDRYGDRGEPDDRYTPEDRDDRYTR